MKRIGLLVMMMAAAVSLKAQNNLPQFAVGAGIGATTTYDGGMVAKTAHAVNVNISYYPTKNFNITLESQFGQFGGGQFDVPGTGLINAYQAFIIEPVLHMGAFFNGSGGKAKSSLVNKLGDGFGNFLKKFYVGTGFGVINNSVGNTGNINQTLNYSNHIVAVVPLKIGYEFNLADHFDHSIVKLNLSYSYNAALSQGLDGYYHSAPHVNESYGYYSLQFEIPISLPDSRLRRHF